MVRWLIIIGVILILEINICVEVSGQHTGYDAYDWSREREAQSEVYSDLTLFYTLPEGASNLFQQLTQFNFSAVKYSLRGYGNTLSPTYVNGLDISGIIQGADYPLMVALGRIYAPKSYSWGLTPGLTAVGGVGQTTEISVRAGDMPQGNTLSVTNSDRGYMFGLRASSSGVMGKGKWNYSANASRRWGRDAHVDGVFTDDNVFSVALQRNISEKHSISLFAVAAPLQQGLRSASMGEAFELTGDNLYNPAWGYYNGDVRNSKVRESMQPMAILSYYGTLTPKTKLTSSVSYHFGESSYSALSWYDAQTPYPDYYRVMPSFFTDQPIENDLAQLWRKKESDVVQIDWDELVYRNENGGSNPSYIVENRIENRNDMQGVLLLDTKINSRLQLNYGVRARRETTENYKKAKDLLGGEWFSDIDQFLIDDEFWGDKLNNNMGEPKRRVGHGDKFGYNYTLSGKSFGAQAIMNYRNKHLRLLLALDGSMVDYGREGLYEKELLPGTASLGCSDRVSFTTYNAKAIVGYAISPRHNIDLSLMSAHMAPKPREIFISPEYSNAIMDNAEVYRVTSGELSYAMSLPSFKFSITGFYTLTQNQSQIYHYYDDISSTYSNMILSGIDKRYYGGEAGAQITLGSGFSFNLAAAIGSYTYANNPRVDILSDADVQTVVSNDASHMKGYRIGSTPQSVCSAELRYGANGWLATATLSHMADNSVSISPLRRMPRAYELADSPEKFEQFTLQQRLPNVTVIDLFLLKSFFIGSTQLYALVSVKNIAGRNDIIYNGYEQMRIGKSGTGVNRVYSPFASKYLYGYGRTYFCSITYKF